MYSVKCKKTEYLIVIIFFLYTQPKGNLMKISKTLCYAVLAMTLLHGSLTFADNEKSSTVMACC